MASDNPEAILNAKSAEHAALLAAQGETREEIARLTGFSLPTVTTWCQRFQLLRLDGLTDKPSRGRNSPLPADTVRRVLEQVTKPRIVDTQATPASSDRR